MSSGFVAWSEWINRTGDSLGLSPWIPLTYSASGSNSVAVSESLVSLGHLLNLTDFLNQLSSGLGRVEGGARCCSLTCCQAD